MYLIFNRILKYNLIPTLSTSSTSSILNTLKENFVPISANNIKPPPYNDVVLMEQAKINQNQRENFENDLKLNYSQDPIINDVPIDIIYDKMTTTYSDI
jgi:uncharacterized surface anchored protein